jgi:Cu-Zn family superoxide dismutase
MRRSFLLALVLSAVLAGPAWGLPNEYVLPGKAVFPEGVAVRPGTSQFFVSSTSDGTVFRGTLGKSRTKVFLAPGKQGRVGANGLEATRDRLVVAGSLTGFIFVYDLPRGRLVRRFATGTGGLVNDVTVAPNGDVYATDSMRGLIFRVPARAIARRRSGVKAIRPFLDVKSTPIGSYANGLVPAGERYLLVVGLSTGVLGRIDLRTKRVRVVAGATLLGGDGLARTGRTLYAVNSGYRVTELRLSRDWLHATVRHQITSPRFRFPTTVAIAGRRLLVVNSQFDKRGGTPVLPFTVSAVRRP